MWPTAATYFNGRVYLFAIAGSEFGPYDIYVDSTGNGVWWTGWTRIPATTPAEPVATVYNNRLYLFDVGTDDHVYDNVSSDGVHWSGWGYIGGTTYSGLAATVYNSQLYLFDVGTDNRIYDSTSSDGVHWLGWGYVPGSSTVWPPVVAVVTGLVHLYNIGTCVYESIDTPRGWTGWTCLPSSSVDTSVLTTGYAPAVTPFKGELYVFDTLNADYILSSTETISNV
jgi:hypothetical protein